MSNASKYDTDFYAWATEQAALLREGRFAEADIANIAPGLAAWAEGEEVHLTVPSQAFKHAQMMERQAADAE